MGYRAIINSEKDVDRLEGYQELIDNNSESSFFHTQSYINSLKKTNGFKPVTISVVDENGYIEGLAVGELTDEISILPYLTRRLILYAPPIYTNEDVLKLLLDELKRQALGLFIQIRYFKEINESDLEIYISHGYQFQNHLNAFIKIDDIEEVYRGFDKDKKKGIRKAKERYGISITEYDDILYSIDSFYKILALLYGKKRHAVKKKNYFYNLISESKGKVRIAFALYQGNPIATQLYIVHQNRVTMLYTATLEEHRGKHAGDLLIWEMILKAKELGIMCFDFGGGGDPDKEYGARDYKKRFGTCFENVGRLTLPTSPIYKLVMNIYKCILKR